MSTLRTSNLIHGSSSINNIVLDTQGRAIFGPNSAQGRASLYVNPQNNRVGINNESPAVALDVDGAINATGNVSFTGNLTVDTNTLFVDATNNRVGIGTDNPTQLLELESASPRMRLIDSDVSTGGQVSGSNGNLSLTYDVLGVGGKNFSISDSTAERMQIDSSGNVKLFTPATPFVNAKNLSNYLGIADNYTPGMIMKVPDLYSGEWSVYLVSNASVTNFVIADGNNDRMRIDSSGRLLVGTSSGVTGTNPQYALIQTLGNSAGAGDGRIVIGRGGPASGFIDGESVGQINFTDNGAADFASIRCFTDGLSGTNDYPGRLVFSTTADGASSPTERLRIDSLGRVGIGTTSPNSNLTIDGDATTRIQLITGSNVVSSVQGIDFYDRLGAGSFTTFPGQNAAYVRCERSGSAADFSLTFGTAGAANASERMRIDSTGNITFNGGTVYAFNGSSSYSATTTLKLAQERAQIIGQINATGGLPGASLQFLTMPDSGSPTERMRIDSNGQIQMGRTSAVGDERLAVQSTTGKCAYVFQGANANRNCMELRNTYAQGGQTAQMIRFVQANGGQVGQITSTASATQYLSGASDRRLKKNIEDWNEDVLQHFKTLNPRKFNYLAEEEGNPKTKGYIAQDLAEAFPEAYPNLYYEDAEEDRYSYNPGGMVVYLMKALQEEIVKREALEQRLSDAGL